MQHPKNRLATAMAKYTVATQNMEQVVMFPSLLRDVPVEWQQGICSADDGAQDLYESYMMLKSIRMTVETGAIPLDDWAAKEEIKDIKTEIEECPDLEAMYQSHIKGLVLCT
uniref:Thyroid hormone-responsive protein n=1 Tax=Ambystoma mexicanum TaxID=8296 RepID=I3NN27_AMBME|nr:thyroid hormone-responsive protein [Ambystoma mexicanum]